MGKSWPEAFRENILPALITALVGGAVLGFIVPRVQASYAESKAVSEKKVQIFEEFSRDASLLISNLLIYGGYADLEIDGLSEGEVSRLVNAAEEARKRIEETHLKLKGTIAIIPVFFGPAAQNAVREFDAWSSGIIREDPNNLQSSEQLFSKVDEVIAAMSGEISARSIRGW